MCMMSPKCHIVYCIVLAWIVQSNLTVANKLFTLPYPLNWSQAQMKKMRDRNYKSNEGIQGDLHQAC